MEIQSGPPLDPCVYGKQCREDIQGNHLPAIAFDDPVQQHRDQRQPGQPPNPEWTRPPQYMEHQKNWDQDFKGAHARLLVKRVTF